MRKIFAILFAIILFAVGGRVFWAYQQVKSDELRAQNSTTTLAFNQQSEKNIPISSSGDLSISEIGLSMKYDPKIWAVKYNKYTNQPHVIYSREKLVDSISENSENARYLISWSEISEQELKSYGDSVLPKISGCEKETWFASLFDKVVNGTRIQGCEVTVYGRPSVKFLLTHPITKNKIIIYGNSRPNSLTFQNHLVPDVIDAKSIHNEFERLILSISFDKPVKNEISQSVRNKMQEDLNDIAYDLESRSMMNMAQVEIETYKQTMFSLSH